MSAYTFKAVLVANKLSSQNRSPKWRFSKIWRSEY